MPKSRLIIFSLILAFVAFPFLAAYPAHAGCAGSTTSVDCNGIDADGWDGSIEAPGATTTVTIHTGADVQDTVVLDGSDTLNVESGGGLTTSENRDVLAMNGGNTIDNAGTIATTADSADAYAITSYGDGSQLTNSGAITALGNAGGAEGAYIEGNNTQIANGGTIDATGANWAAGVQVIGQATTIDNSGTLNACGPSEGYGLYVQSGGAQITNGGTINALSNSNGAAIVAYGDGVQITNDGTLDAQGGQSGHGVYVSGGDAEIVNAGSITASGDTWAAGMEVYGAGAAITNSGTITATNAIYTGGGSQSVTNSGTLNGDVLLGSGDDAFTAGGGSVDGLIDGGDDYDTLTFAFDVLDVDYAAVADLIATASPGGGTLTYGGATYLWRNFEELVNMLRIVATHSGGGSSTVVVTAGVTGIVDGRLNRLDPAATAIVYPLLAGGVDLYTPQGDWAFSADADALIVALANAAASGAPVEVATELGISLYALPDGTLLATGPDGYTFVFLPADCGLAL